MFKRILSFLAITCAALAIPSLALASYPDTYFGLPDQTTSGFYIGLQGGLGVVDVKKGSFTFVSPITIPTVALPQLSVTMPAVNSRNIAGRLDFGYYFNPYFGVELGGSAWDSSDVTWQGILTPPNPYLNGFSLKGSRNDYAADLLAKLNLPVYKKLHAFGKAGAAYVVDRVRLNTKIPNINGTNQILINAANAIKHTLNTNSHRFAPELAAGVGYQLNENWDFSLNYSHIFGHGSNPLSNSTNHGSNNNNNRFIPKLSMLTLAVEWDI